MRSYMVDRFSAVLEEYRLVRHWLALKIHHSASIALHHLVAV